MLSRAPIAAPSPRRPRPLVQSPLRRLTLRAYVRRAFQKLNATLQKLTGRGVLTEDAVREGLREIRRILLEADVSFDLTREFLERVQAQGGRGRGAQGRSGPGQQIVKIVYDELVALLGEKQAPIAFASVPPTVILLVGLQGSGKTTTAGKLAKRLKLEQKAPFLVAADVYRPAAIEQLRDAGAAGGRRRPRRAGRHRTWSKIVQRGHRGGRQGAGAHGASWTPPAGCRSTTR